MMTATARLILTIVFGWLGIHKFIDKKPLQGILYIFTFGLFFFGWIIDIAAALQFYNKKRIDKIENTTRTLGIIFSILLFVSCFFYIGTEDFLSSTFTFMLIVGISIFKIFVIDNKKHCLSYSNINITHKNIINQASNLSNRINTQNQQEKNIDTNNPKIKLSYGRESYSDYDAMNTKIKYKTGKFYEEENIIIEKYRNLRTPNYILIQIREQLHPTSDVYFTDNEIELSNKFKDKYLDYADFYPLNSYWAQLKDLNEYQLKWYLYWRKEFLNGNILDTDISYIFIFSYELIAYTFNCNASFNISALEKLYNSYKNLFPKLEAYLPGWINDMLSEVGYFYNASDTDIIQIEEDLLVNTLVNAEELDKISINTWKKHYNERKSDLTNGQLNLVYGNQKFNNKIKKYAGLLAKYYVSNNVDIISKWFDKRIVTEKRSLFNSVPCTLQRMEGTFKYKKYFSSSAFEYDMNQITKLCYDLTFPQNDQSENDYVIKNYIEGKYDLPNEFFYTYFNNKNEGKSSNSDIEEKDEKKEFTIDMSVIEKSNTKIEYIYNTQEKLNFSLEEKEFLNKFYNGFLNKVEAQQYCIKKGKMLNAYITELNEKYFNLIHKEIMTIEDDKIKLNIDWEENE
jgi:TM2 domain-containing membrane protein YozV